MKKISSLTQLKQESKDGAEFFISLRYNLKSRKWINWDKQDNVFHVINFIDGSEQVFTEKQISNQEFTNIGYAITKGWLYKDC